MKVISRFALAFTIASILYLLVSRQLLSRSPIVIALQLVAVALSVWARRSFPRGQFSVHPEPREARLIEAGPYRLIRHPMYAAVLLLVWSGALAHHTPVALAVATLLLVVVGIRVATEEQALRAAIPGYQDYARRTKRFVPFIW